MMTVNQSSDVILKVLNPLTIYFLIDSSMPDKYVGKLQSLNKNTYIDRRIFTIRIERRNYFSEIAKNHPGCNVLVRLFGEVDGSSQYIVSTIDMSSSKNDILQKLKELIENVYDLNIGLLEKQHQEYEHEADLGKKQAVSKILRAFRLTKPKSRSDIGVIRSNESRISDSDQFFERAMPGLDMVSKIKLKKLMAKSESRSLFTPEEYEMLRQTLGLVIDLKGQEDRCQADNNEESIRILPYEGWKSPCRFLFNGSMEEVRMSGRLSVFIYVLALLVHKKGGVIDRFTLMWTIKEEVLDKGSDEIQQWFKDLYKELLHPGKNFPEWWKEITEEMGNFDTDITQAVTNINGSIRKAIGNSCSLFRLKSEKFDPAKGGDPRKVAYYYITLPKERIYLPEQLEQLLRTMPEFLVHTPGTLHIEE